MAIVALCMVLTGYALIRKDRGSRGGGVILAISKSLSYQVLITPPSLELLCVEVNHSNSIIYCLVYIPPNASNEYLQEFFSYTYLSLVINLTT